MTNVRLGGRRRSPRSRAGGTDFRVWRVYEPGATGGGACFLVDRLWPRGLKKEDLKLTGWAREAAPSDGLRHWFAHDPAKWTEFQRRYRAELEAHPEAWRPLLEAADSGPVTLLYSARDTAHNNAVVLQQFLTERWSARDAG
jgi:uncharacterized protein YeaO (DUF488 family)